MFFLTSVSFSGENENTVPSRTADGWIVVSLIADSRVELTFRPSPSGDTGDNRPGLSGHSTLIGESTFRPETDVTEMCVQ